MLVGFSGHPIHVHDYQETRTTFGEGDRAKTINIRYIVVNVPSSYNVLLGILMINKLGDLMSSVHIKVKYHSNDGLVRVIKVDQREARKCYRGSLKS